MSKSSRDYYYSSSSRVRDGSQYAHLPPIHDVVGDVLQQPARPSSSSHEPQRSTNRTYTQTPQPQSHSRGHHSSANLELPPIHAPRHSEAALPSRYATHSPTPRNYYSSSSSRATVPQTYTPARGTAPAHSYDVFVSTSSDGLIHKRSSHKDDFHHVPKEDAIASSTGKHVCPECGRRFEKLSTLKNHLTTHSGAKPYACPDCGKSFSVSSNMRRHQLTHRPGGPSMDHMRS